MARRRGGAAAPMHCRKTLSHCMKGRGGRAKARSCMLAFNRCRKRG